MDGAAGIAYLCERRSQENGTIPKSKYPLIFLTPKSEGCAAGGFPFRGSRKGAEVWRGRKKAPA